MTVTEEYGQCFVVHLQASQNISDYCYTAICRNRSAVEEGQPSLCLNHFPDYYLLDDNYILIICFFKDLSLSS